jgi:replicative DNA helicase
MNTTPHNTDAEADFLSCVLVRETSLDESGHLEAADFFLPMHRVLFEAILAVRKRGERADGVTAWDEIVRAKKSGHFSDGWSTIAAIAQRAPVSFNARGYAAIVRRDALLRRIMGKCTEINQAAQAGDSEAEAILGRAIREFADMAMTGAGGPEHVGKNLDAVINVIEQKHRAPTEFRVMTGLREFDSIIGGFGTEQLVVVAARPGMGKTALAGTVALSVARSGVPVLVFSLEMSFQEMAERFLSAASRIGGHALSTGRIRSDQFASLNRAASGIYSAPLYVDDRMLSISQIMSTARSWRLRQESKRCLIVIDYIGLVKSEGRVESRQIEVGAMSKAAKTLAKELHVPVMLLSQLNRKSEEQDRKPILSDLRESGGIEQDADMVIFPWREPPLHVSGKAELIVAKHRGGPRGLVPCWWHANTMTFENESEEVRNVA